MTLEMKQVMVTGGAGFIGSHLVDALVERGCRITVLDNLSTGRMENLERARDRITFMEGDIRDLRQVSEASAGCDTIFHEAAVVSVPQTVTDPVGSAGVNDIGTLNVLECARETGVRRVVLASSSAVYGDDPEVPKHEDMTPGPLSPYAVQKLTGEYYAGVYSALYGLETVCLRYFNVYGPRQDPSSPYSGVISIFMDRARSGRQPVIYGDGRQSRDFVFVQDVVRANILAATVDSADGLRLNVGTGASITVNRLWEMVAALFGLALQPAYQPPRAGDILESVASIRKVSSALGYRPEVAFDDGLQRTCDWYTGGR